jgi:hypothetical protein
MQQNHQGSLSGPKDCDRACRDLCDGKVSYQLSEFKHLQDPDVQCSTSLHACTTTWQGPEQVLCARSLKTLWPATKERPDHVLNLTRTGSGWRLLIISFVLSLHYKASNPKKLFHQSSRYLPIGGLRSDFLNVLDIRS